MTQNRLSMLVVVAATLVALAACQKPVAPPPPPIAIDQAVQDGKVEATIAADDDSGQLVTVMLSLPSGATGPVAVTIPSGTVLYGAGAGGQRLITAMSVTVVLSQDNPIVGRQVATFCMDEFADTPLAQATLSLAPAGGTRTATVEETEPLHKLVDCMAPSTQPVGDKQIAVWAVSGAMLRKSPADALRALTDAVVGQMSIKRRKQLAAIKDAEMKRLPMISSDEYDRTAEVEFQAGLPELREKAATTAKQQFDVLLQHDKPLLASCGYPAETTPLFE